MTHLNTEHWFTDNGPIFADGDIGDRNHEGIVWDMLFSEFVSEIEDPLPEWIQAADGMGYDPTALRESLINLTDQLQQQGDIPDEQAEEIELYCKAHGLADWTDAKLSYLLDTASDDCRVHAMQEWNWIRQSSFRLQCWKLTRDTLDIIVDNLCELASPSELALCEFTIETYSDHKVYYNVPMSVILDLKPGKITRQFAGA